MGQEIGKRGWQGCGVVTFHSAARHPLCCSRQPAAPTVAAGILLRVLGLTLLIPSAAEDPLNPPPVVLLGLLKTFRPTSFSLEPNLLNPLSLNGFASFTSITCTKNI